MTEQRKKFEEWYEGFCLPAEADWFRREKDDPEEYFYANTHFSWMAWQAAIAAAAEAAQPVAVPDERAAFEAWARSKAYSVRKFPSGYYYEQHETGCAWDAWQARAQLSAATKPVAVPDEWINTVNAAAIALEAAFANVPAGTGDPSCRANLVPTLSALRDMHRAMLSAAPKPEGVE